MYFRLRLNLRLMEITIWMNAWRLFSVKNRFRQKKKSLIGHVKAVCDRCAHVLAYLWLYFKDDSCEYVLFRNINWCVLFFCFYFQLRLNMPFMTTCCFFHNFFFFSECFTSNTHCCMHSNIFQAIHKTHNNNNNNSNSSFEYYLG